jgi:hypothetical protein
MRCLVCGAEMHFVQVVQAALELPGFSSSIIHPKQRFGTSLQARPYPDHGCRRFYIKWGS